MQNDLLVAEVVNAKMLTNGVLRVQIEYSHELASNAFSIICQPGAKIITGRLREDSSLENTNV